VEAAPVWAYVRKAAGRGRSVGSGRTGPLVVTRSSRTGLSGRTGAAREHAPQYPPQHSPHIADPPHIPDKHARVRMPDVGSRPFPPPQLLFKTPGVSVKKSWVELLKAFCLHGADSAAVDLAAHWRSITRCYAAGWLSGGAL